MPKTKSGTAKKKDSLIRDSINKRLDKLGITRYALANGDLVDASPSTIYRFLNGDIESNSGNIDEIFAALNMTVVFGKTPAWIKNYKAKSN